jgi:hypothetical protein
MPSFFKRPTTEYSDPVNGQRWKAEDTALVTKHYEAQSAKLNEQIKDAKGRGVKTGISSEAGKMIPPPPGLDPFHGKKCMGPGKVKGGFGNPRICGRQAVGVLRTFKPDLPDNPSIESQSTAANRRLAMEAYGGGYDPSASDFYKARMYADAVPKGGMVPDPLGSSAVFVCQFHGMAGYKDSLHPDDGGIVPEAPKLTGDVVFGLDKLTPGRPFRSVGQDANFVWVSDGKVTVMCHKADYVALLAEYGLLPDDTTQPLP